MTDLRQQIIDRASACMEQDLADGEDPIRWTPADLALARVDINERVRQVDLAESIGGSFRAMDIQFIGGEVRVALAQPRVAANDERVALPIVNELSAGDINRTLAMPFEREGFSDRVS